MRNLMCLKNVLCVSVFLVFLWCGISGATDSGYNYGILSRGQLVTSEDDSSDNFVETFTRNRKLKRIFERRRIASPVIQRVNPSVVDFNRCELIDGRKCVVDIFGSGFSDEDVMELHLDTVYLNGEIRRHLEYSFNFINRGHIQFFVNVASQDLRLKIALYTEEAGRSEEFVIGVKGYDQVMNDDENICGDGRVTQREECDDGNNRNNDGCSSQCLIEDDSVLFCGNGVVDLGEQCDDNNNMDGDGCSARCFFETVQNEDVVATIEMERFSGDKAILRATLPVPEGTYFPESGLSPLKVVDTTGEVLADTNTEVVVYYADSKNKGASVVEVVAQVSKQDNADTMWRYNVILDATPAVAINGDGAFRYLTSGMSLPGNVIDLLSDSNNFQIVTHDVYGNRYRFRPMSEGTVVPKKVNNNSLRSVRIFGFLKPDDPTANGVLPSIMEAIVYVTTMKGSQEVKVDLQISNALCNIDDSADYTSASDLRVFRDLKIYLNEGPNPDNPWKVFATLNDPFFDNTPHFAEDGVNSYDVISAFENGDMQVLPHGMVIKRRLAVAPVDREFQAKKLLEQEGLGFVVKSPWSWQTIANYMPMNLKVGEYDHLGQTPEASRAAVRDKYAGYEQARRQIIESGQATGVHPTFMNACGAVMPLDYKDPLAPGGAGINANDGTFLINSASLKGVLYTMYEMRGYDVRQHNRSYNIDGTPIKKSQFTHQCANMPDRSYQSHEINFLTLEPLYTLEDTPCHFNSVAAQSQTAYAYAEGLVPECLSDINKYPPIWSSHVVRVFRHSAVLAYLVNDLMAKDQIQELAELTVMGQTIDYKEQSNGECSQPIAGSLLQKEKKVNPQMGGDPGVGVDFTRITGWASYLVALASSIVDQDERESFYDWAHKYTDIGDMAQQCSGVFNNTPNSSYCFDENGNYANCAMYFHEILVLNGYVSLLESMFRDVDAERTAQVEQIVLNATETSINDSYWSAYDKPYWRFGTSLVGNSSNIYCNENSHPVPADFLWGENGATDWSAPPAFIAGLRYASDPTIYIQYLHRMYGDNVESELKSRINLDVKNVPGEYPMLLPLMTEMQE